VSRDKILSLPPSLAEAASYGGRSPQVACRKGSAFRILVDVTYDVISYVGSALNEHVCIFVIFLNKMLDCNR